MRALDLFAGTGWGVACQRLGISEMGVDNDPDVIATRAANSMETVYQDVWDGLADSPAPYKLLIASPPCQTFTVAGAGSGRRDMGKVLAIIDSGDYRELHKVRRVVDSRTVLVLAPLVHVYRDRPTYVAMEQVPPALPVWEAMAREMRTTRGYSVWTGVLDSEAYGLPQTRKRAFLIARADGHEAVPPIATHSRYNTRSPNKIDSGVPRWTSIEDALGSTYAGLKLETCYTSRGALNYRASDRPAWTITSKRHRWRRQDGTSRTISVDEASRLQSYPDEFEWIGSGGSVRQQIGNAVPPSMAEHVLRTFR